jgi:ABC-type multidrug transport system fused ATPase/permease subunit
LVGERGITLSGGQRQRVSLARALLRDRELLVLDDTLSSVDAETEARILQALVAYGANRTAIIVSHRTSAVQDADRILVLDAGKLIDEGTHNTLIERGGLYARIHERQRLTKALEDSS